MPQCTYQNEQITKTDNTEWWLGCKATGTLITTGGNAK